ncbi:pentatricopeptide repeat-containing protein, putative [Ricinus communis]|uniref:Pentatricopeptide repeat-containing protein, putative n=1 Tax=Ricinus communis TaxID=3988 RepID=B9SJA6_RICCO|nr:pentatricopeptide repeat-containing protein, putative [Ricinus communis]
MLNRGLKPNLTACNALMNSLGKAGEYKLAFKVLEKVKSLGHTPDAYTWNALLNGLYRANQPVDALQLFESIKRGQSSQINEHLYNTALMSCQKVGLWDKALQLLWQLESSGLPVSTTSYNLVIGACETARKPKVALQQVAPDVSLYNAVVHGMCLRGKFESAKKLYMKMRRSGLKPDGKTRALMLQNLKRGATKRSR